MQHPYRLSLTFLFLVVHPACGHAPTQSAESSGFGQGGAALPDGRYALRPLQKSDPMQTLDIVQGRATLSAPTPQTLTITGAGPLWHLAGAATEGTRFEADLLVVDGDRGWILPSGMDHATDFARIRDVPQALRGPWTPAPKIDSPIHGRDSLQLAAAGGVITRQNGNRIEFPAAWMPSRGETSGALLVTMERFTGLLTIAAQNGLLALSLPEDGPAIFVDDRAQALPPLTLDKLRDMAPIYFTGREAYDLRCGTGGCDLVELANAGPAYRFQVKDSQPAFSLWLRQHTPEMRTMVLVPMNGRPLAVGYAEDAVALVKVAASAIPSSLVGTWNTSAVFPLDTFGVAEIRIDKNGATTTRPGEQATPAYLVQSAYDDGLLLLEHRAGSKKWNLWRLTQGRDRWYLSRWKDGAGPVALWQGTKPSWLSSSIKSVDMAAKHPVDAAIVWQRLDHETKKAATNALNAMWLGAVVFHEANRSAGTITKAPFKFPGRGAYAFTPDACAQPTSGASAVSWSRDPWSSLNFKPADNAAWMGFDFISVGEGAKARFLAIVAIDSDCTGKPVYAWRRGKVSGDDVEGAYQPEIGGEPPPIPAADSGD